MKNFVATIILLFSWHIGVAGESRPAGTNCNLTQPPSDSGEEGGHGYVLLIFPRTGSIGPQYTGCQSVFVKDTKQGVRLAWVVEFFHGDPKRMWSADKEMKEVLPCRYKNRKLLSGDPEVCPDPRTLLLPTQPPGCFTEKIDGGMCQYDVE
jgi:hypothetical protein